MRYFKLNEQIVAALSVIVFTVGIAGISNPSTRAVFIPLTPLILVLSLFVSLLFHNEVWNVKTVLVFTLLVVLAWLVEAYGVATGKIFGFYNYGHSLGLKILGTPVLIGFNWLFLVYGSTSIVSGARLHFVNKALLASFLMVTYDFFLEIMAPYLAMWEFDDGTAPIRNYIAWFIIAFAFHSLVRLSGIRMSNRIASFIFLLQFFFFIILSFIHFMI
ncbi:MAG TPA: carotenoid biosynthesis protein [Bacteroidales bacterium]|nr:carotenoid biosynthesis protein [Bacteroidales bacterium]